jgi:hypothetical protein
MSVYVGIDVHRKRSQVSVLEADGQRRLNRNLVNGSAALTQLLGDLPAGTPVAFEAAYGWTWLLELLDDLELEPHLAHASRCKAIASARLKDDRVDARTLAQLLRADLLPEPGSPRSRCGHCGPCCGIGWRWCVTHHGEESHPRRARRRRPGPGPRAPCGLAWDGPGWPPPS